MKTTERGINLIKEFEGCRLEAYKCPAGVWTIGYGHTGGVKEGQVITKEKATNLLKDDLKRFEDHVESFRKKYNWNQNQFDAMVSFAYNIGSINQLTANGTRTIQQISGKITAYNKAAGKVLKGLERRRAAEKALFDTPAEPDPKASPKKKKSKVSKKKVLEVGSKVKIKTGAKDANTKGKYASFVYKNVYSVISIKDNYVVFGLQGVVTGKTKKDNVLLQ